MTSRLVPPSRAIAGGIATAALALLVAPLLAALPAAAGAPEASLSWGVKDTFRAYVTSVGAGTVEAVAPAVDDATVTSFPWVAGDAATGSYGGGIVFDAHHGVLHLELTDPSVSVAEGTLTMVVGGVPTVLATLDLDAVAPTTSGDLATYADVPATLTAEGADVFGSYPAGTAMDPVTFTLPAPSEPAPEPEPEPSVDPSTDPSPEPEPEPAEAITVDRDQGLASGDTVTVRGTLPALTGGKDTSIYLMWCAEPDGTLGTEDGRATGADCDPDTQQWLMHTSKYGEPAIGAVTDGLWSFESEIALPAVFGDHACAAAGETVCGIFVRLSHLFPGDYSLDRFIPISFAEDTIAPETGGGTDGGSSSTDGGSSDGGSSDGGSPGGGSTGSTDAGGTTATVGSLTWGVDAGFRAYVTGPIARGAISVTGASSTGTAFTFRQSGGDADADARTGTAHYAGSVRFTGHHGILDLTLANPRVRLHGTSATLTAAVGGARVDVATLDLSAGTRTALDGAVRWSGVPATLTAAGAVAFDGYYPAGRRLDPVSFTVGTGEASAGSGGTTVVATTRPVTASTTDAVPATPPATTGIVLDDATLASLLRGDTVTITVDGFEPHETGIRVVLYSTPTVLASDLTADANGVVTWTGALPGSVAGTHTLTFQGSVDKGIVLDIPARTRCRVDDATLAWGVKASFRAYIESTIAHGDWELDGATYEAGRFSWTGGTGALDTDPVSGAVALTGSVRFTGHGGVLDTTLANPTLEVSGGTATLLLDVTGETQDGQRVAATAVPFAALDLAAGSISTDGDIVTIVDAPATLTAAGAEAFGTYPAGEALDPVTWTLASADACAGVVAGLEAPDTMPVEEPVAESAADPDATVGAPETGPAAAAPSKAPAGGSAPWWPWLAGAGLLVAAAGVAVAIRRRG